jgi:hypothetical protein
VFASKDAVRFSPQFREQHLSLKLSRTSGVISELADISLQVEHKPFSNQHDLVLVYRSCTSEASTALRILDTAKLTTSLPQSASPAERPQAHARWTIVSQQYILCGLTLPLTHAH